MSQTNLQKLEGVITRATGDAKVIAEIVRDHELRLAKIISLRAVADFARSPLLAKIAELEKHLSELWGSCCPDCGPKDYKNLVQLITKKCTETVHFEEALSADDEKAAKAWASTRAGGTDGAAHSFLKGCQHVRQQIPILLEATKREGRIEGAKAYDAIYSGNAHGAAVALADYIAEQQEQSK